MPHCAPQILNRQVFNSNVENRSNWKKPCPSGTLFTTNPKVTEVESNSGTASWEADGKHFALVKCLPSKFHDTIRVFRQHLGFGGEGGGVVVIFDTFRGVNTHTLSNGFVTRSSQRSTVLTKQY